MFFELLEKKLKKRYKERGAEKRGAEKRGAEILAKNASFK